MTKISLSQAVLLAHGVLCFLDFRLFPSVLEVTLSIPKEELKKKIKSSEFSSLRWIKSVEKKKKTLIKTTSDQIMDVPLTGAAFTHFIAFTKKAGSIVTRDLFPRCYGSNHLNTSDILLTGDELGGWKRRKKKTKQTKTKVGWPVGNNNNKAVRRQKAGLNLHLK